ncbi:hypothetical protein SAMN04488066_1124 [Halorubrum aquaticum]|uniref:Uncharacterized protein n=1 Tax=Halorubrum aquaticum TaxID=387340 RepID=A0A1I3BEF8_9EURY|nr:hypothetical protein SAMN04488066_1124 [Halorubrum aquaticum]
MYSFILMEECFNCAASTPKCYTLILEGSTVLKDVAVCRECVSDLRNVEWIEVERPSTPTNSQ